ncbi:MAG: hypothetical protein AB7O91_08650 [Sphingomonas sp.]
MNLVEAVKAFFTKFIGAGKSEESFEIGTQIADATAAERRHAARHEGRSSPLANLRYSTRETYLWRWTDSPVDDDFHAEMAHFAEFDEAERSTVRNSLTMDDFYTLLTFAQRCALAGLRSGDASRIEAAFIGLAMIELERIDWRDLSITSALVRYAGQSLRLPVASLVNRAVQMAEPQTGRALSEERALRIDLAESCGYREVRTPEGVALFETGYEHFAPKADLIKIAFESAVALDAGGYEISSIQVACDMPLTWLSTDEGSPISKMVKDFSGCVSIHGVPRADPAPQSSGQSILVFVAETDSVESARAVAAAADNPSTPERTQLGSASGQLCAVIIQWSWMADTPPIEDVGSLERLRPIVERLLAS